MNLRTLHIGLVVCAVMLMGKSWGQQDPMFSQYMFNTLAINPAYAGSADMLTANIIYRHQWVEFEGAPRTATVVMHGPLRKEAISVGGTLINDQHGPVKQTGIFGDISYRIFFDNSKLAFGLKAGLNLFQANLVDLNPVDEEDPVFAANINNKPLPNFGAGAMWYSKRSYVGLAVPKLLNNPLIDGNLPDFDLNGERRHVFLTAGTAIPVNNYVYFKPSMMVKAVSGAPVSFDVTAQFLFYDKFWLGAMYRFQDAAGVLVQYSINNKLSIGYAYDYILSDIGQYSSGSHEIMIGIDFGSRYTGDVSPRFF